MHSKLQWFSTKWFNVFICYFTPKLINIYIIRLNHSKIQLQYSVLVFFVEINNSIWKYAVVYRIMIKHNRKLLHIRLFQDLIVKKA